ncbi:MAG: BNR repeat-containing protein [Verrucomicrobiaceae bacterium]
MLILRRLLTVLIVLGIHPLPASADEPNIRISTVSNNGMPKNIVAKGADWNFGPGSLWTHKGWQYAAYWDDQRQVSVARRQLPSGDWSVASLPGYQRTASGNRGKGGKISQGFGDGHEKVAMGISPDGVIHLSFDHHLSTLRYRTSKLPIAQNPEAHPWSADLFGPVKDNLGGPQLTSVTYPSFTTDGSRFFLYLRLGGGSGSANSHLFTYQSGKWIINTEPDSKIIDRQWSGGNGTVNAYPFGLLIHKGRTHLTWCWRDTPDPKTCHDLCYAYSDDDGTTWRNNDGKLIAQRGKNPITADTPGISVWPIPSGKRYQNGGTMTIDPTGKIHVLLRGEDGRPAHFQRHPTSAKWTRTPAPTRGSFVHTNSTQQFVLADASLYQLPTSPSTTWQKITTAPRSLFQNCKPAQDHHRPAHDGWTSTIAQQGKKITVIDFRVSGQ